jgi:NADPH-dependent 2,4-dienoyl-CoA reductase/sulfur reductase-like enzyme
MEEASRAAPAAGVNAPGNTFEVDSHKIVVVGGGLAGLAAAIQAYDEAQLSATEVEIVLLEKMPRLGGNSAKVRAASLWSWDAGPRGSSTAACGTCMGLHGAAR